MQNSFIGQTSYIYRLLAYDVTQEGETCFTHVGDSLCAGLRSRVDLCKTGELRGASLAGIDVGGVEKTGTVSLGTVVAGLNRSSHADAFGSPLSGQGGTELAASAFGAIGDIGARWRIWSK